VAITSVIWGISAFAGPSFGALLPHQRERLIITAGAFMIAGVTTGFAYAVPLRRCQ
jgi:hypothetical protein